MPQEFISPAQHRRVGGQRDGDQDQEEKEDEDEDAEKDISSSSFLPQRITRSKFKELGSSGQMFSLFVVSFV